MAGKEKRFNEKLYGIIAFFCVATVLLLICVFTFSSKYMAFYPDRVAENYVSTIASAGDGYNAYKNTALSKSEKFGDFIRINYINPVVTRDSDKNEKDYSDESFMSEKTKKDDGSLMGKLIDEMYPVYTALIEKYSWDDYDAVFSEYISELIAVREEIFGDKFFNDEVFFTAFEANVSSYGNMLKGTDERYDENSGVKLSEKTEGIYEKRFGENYSMTVEAVGEKDVDAEAYKKAAASALYETYGFTADDISEVKTVSVDVKINGEKVASAEVNLIKIGMSWYVDNTTTDTDSLYEIAD